MDPGCAPQGVGASHGADQRADVRGDGGVAGPVVGDAMGRLWIASPRVPISGTFATLRSFFTAMRLTRHAGRTRGGSLTGDHGLDATIAFATISRPRSSWRSSS